MILLQLQPSPEPLLGYIDLQCPYDETAIAQFKAMPGCSWDKDRRVWYAPTEAANALARTLIKADIAKLRKGKFADSPPSPEPLDLGESNLYDYQQQGVSFVVDRCRRFGAALLADDLGLGKSIQALHVVKHIKPKNRILIVCPAVVVEHWVEEARRWLGIEATRIRSNDPRWKGIGVVSYGVFANVVGKPYHLEWRERDGDEWFRHETFDSRKSAEWALGKQRKEDPEVKWRLIRMRQPLAQADVVVLDEIHYLASSKAQRSKAVRNYLSKRRPEAVVGLSGTPMTTRPKDLHHPLDLLWPRRFGGFFDFSRRYCDGHYKKIEGLDREVWDCSGASRIDELSERLQPLMIRRTKNQVLELPERQRIMLPVALPTKAATSAAIAWSGIEDRGEVKRALEGTEEHKIPAAVELAADLVRQGHRVLLLTTRRATAAAIAKKLRVHKIDAPVATGETPAARRATLLNAARSAAVATMFSVTTGINLVGFDVTIFVGLDWVPTILLQAEGRTHRIGSKQKVTYYYLIGMGSIDEVIRSAVIERLDHFVTLMGDGSRSDEAALASSLGKKDEDNLIADIVAMVKEKAKERKP